MNAVQIRQQIVGLPAMERRVVWLVAIFYLPVTRTELFKALQKYAPGAPGAGRGGSGLGHQLDMALNRLTGLGLLLEEKISRGVNGVRMPSPVMWE
ncbi:MAG: hypothetical protein HQL95_12570, partial [Magnetococcales bacterium]|nr:hypothetical protein [Magnetococcales bacterium]